MWERIFVELERKLKNPIICRRKTMKKSQTNIVRPFWPAVAVITFYNSGATPLLGLHKQRLLVKFSFCVNWYMSYLFALFWFSILHPRTLKKIILNITTLTFHSWPFDIKGKLVSLSLTLSPHKGVFGEEGIPLPSFLITCNSHSSHTLTR